MPKYLTMPKIGMNMTEGVITKWLIKPGDRVEKEQVVLESETDKSVQEIIATESGIVHALLAAEGETVPTQARIAVLLEEGEDPASVKLDDEKPAATPQVEAKPAATVVEQPKAEKTGGRLRISPLARKTAAELGIDTNDLTPREPGLRITKADVLAYLKGPQQAVQKKVEAGPGEFVPFTATRRAIATHMVASNLEKPRVTLQASADCENLLAWKSSYDDGEKVSLNALLLKAIAWALRKNPQLNSVSTEGGILLKDEINICIAVEVPKGLITPVIPNVDKQGARAITALITKLAQKAEQGKIQLDELEGGTFTLSNLGSFGVEAFDPVINGKQCAILGVGMITETPVVRNGVISVRKRMNLGLSFDHAMVDGAVAARLLRDIKAAIENPFLTIKENE